MPFEFLDHTSDVRMWVTGQDLQELFRDAALGLVQFAEPIRGDDADPVKRTIQLTAPDATGLLIDFLNDVLVWIHTERECYTDCTFDELTTTSLKARLSGYRADGLGEDIKAVTYHEADVSRHDDGIWGTNVIFDL